jgi:cell division protein FtsQ
MDKNRKYKNTRTDKKKPSNNFNKLRLIVRNLCLFLLLIGLIVGIWALKNPQFFPIRRVAVEASFQHINQQTLRDVIIPYTNKKTFFTIPIGKLRASLLTLPWVFEATVSRVWPDKLRVIISEQEVVARWNDKALFNTKGKVFIPPKMPVETNWPLLTGSDDQEAIVWQRYVETNKLLHHIGLNVIRMDLLPTLDLRILLNNGISMILINDNFANSIETFMKAYFKILKSKQNQIESMDFRYNNGFAVKFKN